MKIIITNDVYEDNGGAGQVFKNTIVLLKNNGHNVYPFVVVENNFLGTLPKEYFFFKKPKSRIRAFILKHFDPELFNQFRMLIKKVNPDLIHCQQNLSSPLSFLLAAKLEKVPVVQTLHDFNLVCLSSWGAKKTNSDFCIKGAPLSCLINRCLDCGEYFRNVGAWYIRKLSIKHYTKVIIAPSKSLAVALKENDFSNVETIPNFVYPPENLRMQKRKRKNNFLLFVGRLTPQKGCQYLINAMKIIEKSFSDVNLLVIGDGPERKKLERLSSSLNFNKVKFLGEILYIRTGHYFERATMIIIPSIWMENCPLVVLEAMSYGIPVIGSRIGGIPELIQENKTGMLFRPRDSTDLAKKIIYLLKYPDVAYKMGLRSIEEYRRKYTSEIHYKKLIKVYKKLVN